MPKASGGKINRSHTTMTDDAEAIVKKAQKWDEVTKISLGIIKWGLKSRRRGVSIKVDRGCVITTVTMPHSMQELFFYSDDPEHTAGRLRAKKIK